MKSIFWIYTFVFSLLNSIAFSQVGKDNQLLKDQNPNYIKSKNKYTQVPIDTTAKKTGETVTTNPKGKDSLKFTSTITNTVSLSGIELIKQKITLAQKNNDNIGLMSLYNAAGEFYVATNNFPLALESYQKSLKISNNISNKNYIFKNTYDIGNVHLKQSNYPKAENFFETALDYAKKNKFTENVKLASNALSKVYVKQGNFKNAYEMQLLFKQTTDSLYQVEAQRTLEENVLKNQFVKHQLTDSLNTENIKSNYNKDIKLKETEIKNKQLLVYFSLAGILLALVIAIAFYRNYKTTKTANIKIQEQKQQVEDKNTIIEKALEEKEMLIKEIHHRVKNNLQIVSSLLNLQSNRLEDNELKKTMIEAKNRIASMALIHQNIYQSGNLASINFKEYVEQMCHAIDNTFKNTTKINYSVLSENITLDMDTSVPLGLLINEILTNVYKYAFKNKTEGLVTIELKEQPDDFLELIIKDNGTGFPNNFDINQSKSLGLKLVKGLAGQLNGTIHLCNNNGAQFKINFKNKSV